MKKLTALLIVAITLTVLLVPLFAIKEQKSPKTEEVAASYIDTKEEPALDLSTPDAQKTVRLYDISTKKVEKIDLFHYILGVVAGEVPISYPEEAIKAQIVAAKTYTLYRMGASKKEKYDVTTDSATSQAYITEAEMKKRWGESYSKYRQQLEDLMNEVFGYTVLYKDKPILAVYHAMSSGATESAENVWGQKLDYLQSVDSTKDKLASGYLSTTSCTIAEASKALKTLGLLPTDLISATYKKTKQNNIISIKANGKEVSGSKIVEMFSLRSPNFTVAIKNNKVVFTVKGYGHQVGMSQTGAKYMASDGADFKEILTHYYSGTTVKVP